MGLAEHGLKTTDAGRRALGAGGGNPRVAGIAITHPERMLFPEDGLTKLDVVRYYERAAKLMLPYVRDRPLSVVRCLSEAGSSCFFQKHPDGRGIPGVESASIPNGEGGSDLYLMANTRRALVGLAQMGAIELHGWGATFGDIEHPDTLVLDLDPDPALGWHAVIGAALLARDLLDSLGLQSFVKTSGGRGLHVVVPLARRNTWQEAKDFAHAVALHIARQRPEHFTAGTGKAKREGKIFIDYLRNVRGATAAVPYTLRARPHATVATPLSWKALMLSVHADTYTLDAALTQDKRQPDPWAGYGSLDQAITPSMLGALRG